MMFRPEESSSKGMLSTRRLTRDDLIFRQLLFQKEHSDSASRLAPSKMTKQVTFVLTIALTLTACNNPTVNKISTTSTDISRQTVAKQTTTVPPDSGERKLRASDCVRGTPEPVVKKNIFPKTTFQLQADGLTAYETVDFDNGDKLIITNAGCEYYVLTFRFETARFKNERSKHNKIG